MVQAVTVLVAMASVKNIWRLNFWRKSPIGDLQVKRETRLKIVNDRAKVECANLNELQLKMANLIGFKGFCAPLAMLPGLSIFVMLK